MIYLTAGILAGLGMAFEPNWLPFLLAPHAHLNLVGFVSLVIFGVAYHILPRFRGRPLWSDSLALWQFRLANVGLVGLVVVWIAKGFYSGKMLDHILGTFGLVLTVSFILFVVNIWKTLEE
ncbi:MAG: hypothetical protein HYU64_11885 [Armatimonadetes bacterium]|nr:hypothetical protein [Armatimonadota bacterium]